MDITAGTNDHSSGNINKHMTVYKTGQEKERNYNIGGNKHKTPKQEHVHTEVV